MAVALNGLETGFRQQVEELLRQCLEGGVEMRPYTGVRTPEVQAKLWRQSRAKEEINAAIARLKQSGAPFLASVIDGVGPQHGPHVTNALPGLGWHQWGEAVDCFWALNGTAEWSTTKLADGLNGYKFYAGKAKLLGLTAGGFWTSFKDWPHVQLRTAGSPVTAGVTVAEIDEEMKKRFG